jgi:hypothetical protein
LITTTKHKTSCIFLVRTRKNEVQIQGICGVAKTLEAIRAVYFTGTMKKKVKLS